MAKIKKLDNFRQHETLNRQIQEQVQRYLLSTYPVIRRIQHYLERAGFNEDQAYDVQERAAWVLADIGEWQALVLTSTHANFLCLHRVTSSLRWKMQCIQFYPPAPVELREQLAGTPARAFENALIIKTYSGNTEEASPKKHTSRPSLDWLLTRLRAFPKSVTAHNYFIRFSSSQTSCNIGYDNRLVLFLQLLSFLETDIFPPLSVTAKYHSHSYGLL